VRETLEETGLRVRATGVIGSRMHPGTGVRMVYVASVPTAGTDVDATEDELAEVQWVTVSEADELMGDILGAVREYLARTERWKP
jgi:8-oxo-dGTP diphosphatase